jgi:hypothetical protein
VERFDDARAIYAAVQVARQLHRALGQRNRIGVAEKIRDQRPIAGSPRRGSQRAARDRRDQEKAGFIWRTGEQG